MTTKLPLITAADAIRALEKAGFVLARQSGSHKIYKNLKGRKTTVPYHAGKILHPKVLKSIIKDVGLAVEQFQELLKQLQARFD